MDKRRYNKYYPGMTIGGLTLKERLPGGQKWLCECECGNTVITQISGGSRHCNECASKYRGKLKHGYNRLDGPDRLYRIWIGMKSRCNNRNDTGYRYYGGRGISVCKEWDDNFMSFRDWSLSHGYNEDLTIDRVDNDGNYEPMNCHWITKRDQAKNKRFSPYKYGRDEYGRFKRKEEKSDG